MATKTYNLFISHSWAYSDAYDRLVGLLDAAPNFSYRNYSIPRDDPVHDAPNVAALYAAIKMQMTFCHTVVILAGVYATYSKWIEREIECAKRDLFKPLVAIQPWGSERTSTIVRDNADRLVGWSTSSVVSAIRELAL